MQDREFEKLMNGKPAKWAEMFTPLSDLLKLNDQLKKDSEVETELKLTLIPGESKTEQREKIKVLEKPIPIHISDSIHKFIKEERRKNVSERAIRRAVKRKWNIYVV